MKQLFSIIFITLLASGCANIARSNYAGDKKYLNIKSASQNSATIGIFEHGKSKTIKISTDSPYLDSENAKGRFEIVSIKGKKDDPFSIVVTSICDCLGFRKLAVVPDIYLIDSTGAAVSTGHSGIARTNFVTGNFPHDGEYNLLIVADEKSEGKKIDEIKGGLAIPGQAFVPDVFTLPMKSHPTGNVMLIWAKNSIQTQTTDSSN